MKKQLLFILITFMYVNSYSQISFEQGYYIDNNGQKKNCLIKNMDWKNNPTEFEYKVTENSEPQIATIESVKEFGIDNISKYIRETVNIDRSTNNLNNLEKDKNSSFQEEQLFLKVLIEGKANLYKYEDGNLIRFFFNQENSAIEQLVYKIYLTPNDKVLRNKQFKQQLWNTLKCPKISMNDVEKVEYKKNSMISFFSRYNSCNNSISINYEEKVIRDQFHITLRPRFNNSSLNAYRVDSDNYDLDFGSKMDFGFGVDLEYILPFNNDKWAITIEPTYQGFKGETKTEAGIGLSMEKSTAYVDYKSVEIPIGVRHYFFLSDDSKIFMNISYVFDFSSKTAIDIIRADDTTFQSLDVSTTNNLAFGAGYKYHRFGLEFRYQTSREVLDKYLLFNSEYRTFSLILGYSLF